MTICPKCAEFGLNALERDPKHRAFVYVERVPPETPEAARLLNHHHIIQEALDERVTLCGISAPPGSGLSQPLADSVARFFLDFCRG